VLNGGHSLKKKNNSHISSERACVYNKFNISETGFFTSLSTADASVNRFRPTLETNIKSRRFFKDIEFLCNGLNLTNQRVKNRACEISSEMAANGIQKSIRLLTIHAACVLYAARMEGGDSNRTFREIAMVAARPQKEIARCFKIIGKILTKTRHYNSMGSNTFDDNRHPTISFAKNYAIYLNLPQQWVLFTEHLASKTVSLGTGSGKSWEGRSRSSIAATVLYILSRLPKFPVRLDVKKIAFRTGVRVSTIMSCYRDMLPVINQLLDSAPCEMVSEKEITNTFDCELIACNHNKKIA